MPRIFPYDHNRFTVSVRYVPLLMRDDSLTRGIQKLIKCQIFPEHMALLVQRQDELLIELKAAADKGFQRAMEEWERTVTA